MTHYDIAVIAGDGIGKEVMPAALPLLEAVAAGARVLEFARVPVGLRLLPAHGSHDAGRRRSSSCASSTRSSSAPSARPRVPDHVSVWELILPIRQRFDQYVNLRPMRLLPGVPGRSPTARPADIDMVCVRENSEGEYAGLGGRMHAGTPHEVAEQTGVFTRRGIERVVRYALELASPRPRRLLASATKSNALQHSMVLWDEVVDEVAAGLSRGRACRKYHVDALAARMVTASADARRDRRVEPVRRHPHRPRRRGLGQPGRRARRQPQSRARSTRRCSSRSTARRPTSPARASPIRSARSGRRALMLEHLGQPDAGRAMVTAIERVLAEGRVRTPDLGGTATTRDMTAAVTAAL